MELAQSIQVYIERIGNLLRSEARRRGTDAGLQPVQLSALHYLSLCNRFSNTPRGVTEYLGLTKGTVSQTLKVLEGRGYIEKHSNPRDRRQVHLSLTEAGEQLLARMIPPPVLVEAVEMLPGEVAGQLRASLQALLDSLLATQEGRGFGVCRSCRYNRTTDQGQFHCALLDEPLSAEDIDRICREHS